jgi:hypothetical protein
MSPTFFLSYARDDATDQKKLLNRFFRDLESEVARRAAIDLRSNRLGVFDGASIEYGIDWDTCLSNALGSQKVCVAVTNASFFKRENCGKELYVFIRRASTAWLDTEGYIRDLYNVLPIRWEDETHYRENGVKDARIPKILQKIEDLVGTKDDDDEVKKAIERYLRHGMAICVKPGTNRYTFLLRVIAERIVAIPDLPPAGFSVGFDKMPNAFQFEWSKLLRSRPDGNAESAPVEPPLDPDGPGSVAAFYLTTHQVVVDPRHVTFADLLLDPFHQPETSPLIALMEAVQHAAASLKLSVFHCACHPSVPLDPTRLTGQLASLSDSNVIVILFVDPLLWPMTNAVQTPGKGLTETIIDSDGWKGPTIVPGLAETAIGVLPHPVRPIIGLSADAQEAVARLQQAFSVEQGRIMKSGALRVPSSSETPPLLRGVDRGQD